MAKKLLNEATVRRFQSLANLKPINEMRTNIEEEQVEETIEENVYEADEAPELMGDEEVPPEAPEEEMMTSGMDVELTEEEAQMLIELGEKLAAAMGEGEPEVDAEMDAPPEMPPVGELEEGEMMEALAGVNYVPSQGEIVNEVARRVARRLAKAQKAEKLMKEALGRK
jgi:hypothetical protein